MNTNPRGTTAEQEKELMKSIWDPHIAENPYNFCMFAFPWGKENTPLHNKQGPRTWQRDIMEEIAEHIKSNKEKMLMGLEPDVYQATVASGRGIGKSAFGAMMDLWMMSCNLGSSTIVTANSESQLKTKTWAELGKWHTMSLNSHWFEKTTMNLKPAPWFEESLKKQLKIDTGYFYAQALLWSEENPDAFAGAHNDAGIFLQFDEASGIPASIWKVSEGFFTEPILHRYWINFSNPRRNTGTFYECFHKFRKYWRPRNIDSRTVEGTDKKVLSEIIEKYGEDSDEARIEVKGEFPRQGDKQFISRELVEEAQMRELQTDEYAPLIMGIDCARFGDDATVFRFRQGRDARSIPAVKIKSMDNMQVASFAAEWIRKVNPDAVCIDAGSGAGVIDRLRALNYKVFEVPFGAQSDSDEQEWANKRTQLWGRMQEWLKGGCIDSDEHLKDDLVGPEYRFNSKEQKILEPKEEMKSRGLASPDNADALACTFAVKVARKDTKASRNNKRGTRCADIDYKVF